MNDDLAVILEQYALSFNELSADACGMSAPALARFYETLLLLHKQEPLQSVDFSSVVQAFQNIPKTIQSMQQLIGYVEQASVLKPDLEMRESLQNLIEFCKKKKNDYPYESSVVAFEAKRWLNKLESHDSNPSPPPCLDVCFSPSLDLDVAEENIDQGFHRISFPVALINTGRLPAIKLRVSFKTENSIRIRQTPSIVRINERNFDVNLKSVIDAGQTTVFLIPLDHIRGGKIILQPYFESIFSNSQIKQAESIEVEFPVAANIMGKKLGNPYCPDIPLPPDSKLMMGNQLRIVDEIISALQPEADRMFVVRGLKRTGKTTILRKLKFRMCETTGYLPIYVDFYRWWRKLSKADKEMKDIDELLYELADSAVLEAKEFNVDTEPANDYVKAYEDKPRMSPNNFIEFLRKLKGGIKGKVIVVFLIDELDSWMNAGNEFRELAQKLMFFLSGLIVTNECSVVFANEWADAEWEQQNMEDGVKLLYKNVRFLDKEHIESLIELGSVLYTRLAREFIWRITGGWPGIAQLVLYRIFEEVQKMSSEEILVDVKTVKNVINAIITTSDNHPFIHYFLKSMDQTEIGTLKTLLEKKLVSKQTSQIEGVRHVTGVGNVFEIPSEKASGENNADPILETLEQKQIIERYPDGHNHFRLRVGLLSYQSVLAKYSDGFDD